MKTAYLSMGSFWSKGAPWKHRRLMLISKIQNTALAGVEAYLPTAKQHEQLDAMVARYARKALRGKAARDTEKGKRQLSNAEVLKHWRLAPSVVELRVRRLKRLHKIAKDLQDPVMILAALFGNSRGNRKARRKTNA